jgi:hypothetical protein
LVSSALWTAMTRWFVLAIKLKFFGWSLLFGWSVSTWTRNRNTFYEDFSGKWLFVYLRNILDTKYVAYRRSCECEG